MRLDTYRLLTAANPNTHLVAIDYRGWGYSSGIPSEGSVIIDGLTALDWLLNTAHVDPSRILLVSQSLGTGIAMGVATHYAERNRDKPLAGIVNIASFTSLHNLVGAYRMGGFLPLLGPLALVPQVRDYFIQRFLRAKFDSGERMLRLVRLTRGTPFSITLVHATNDWEISYHHSRELFQIACDGDKTVREVHFTDRVVKSVEGGRIRHVETGWGGHNSVQKSDAVVKAVISAWR